MYLSSCTGRPHSSSWKAAYSGSCGKEMQSAEEITKVVICNNECIGHQQNTPGEENGTRYHQENENMSYITRYTDHMV